MDARLTLLAIAMATVAGCSLKPEILARDPPQGSLRPGQVVLIEDGRCPAGAITQIAGGDNIAGRPGTTTRTRSCVPRP